MFTKILENLRSIIMSSIKYLNFNFLKFKILHKKNKFMNRIVINPIDMKFGISVKKTKNMQSKG